MILQGFWALPEIFYEYIINILFINTLIKYNCTLVIDGEPWFVGIDVARCLGYANPKNAVPKHVSEEDKLSTQIEYAGQKRGTTVINESGLYALIFGSKLETGKRFKHWVTSEVLPTIRKTGGYVDNDNYMIWCRVSRVTCYMILLYNVMHLSFVYTNRLLRYYFLKNAPPLFFYFHTHLLVYIIFNYMPLCS